MLTLKLKPELASLPLLYAFCDEHAVDARTMLALEEAFVNVASYSGAAVFELSLRRDGDADVFVLVDDGRPFDPVAFTPPENPADQPLTAGGQGIRLIRSLTGSMHYARHDGKNILTLTKSNNSNV